jgi:hypothetical protein
MEMGFWSVNQGVKLTDSMVRAFRRKYKQRLVDGEDKITVEREMAKEIGNSRESVRMMLRGESYKHVAEWSENEIALGRME